MKKLITVFFIQFIINITYYEKNKNHIINNYAMYPYYGV
jgi:hypothetical protein